MLWNHLARRVRNQLDALTRHRHATLARDHAAMLLGDHPARGVADLASGAHGHHLADVVLDDLAVLARHHVASADRALLGTRHIGLLAHPAAGALHLAAAHR